eukprot:361604-Chlamydomonas_euryale.AAC.2
MSGPRCGADPARPSNAGGAARWVAVSEEWEWPVVVWGGQVGGCEGGMGIASGGVTVHCDGFASQGGGVKTSWR